MRTALVALAVCALAACPPPRPAPPTYGPSTYTVPDTSPPIDLSQVGTRVSRQDQWVFDGGRIEFEIRRDGDRVIEIARNRYAVAVVIAWHVDNEDNVTPIERDRGVAVLPPAPTPNGEGAAVVLTTQHILDTTRGFYRNMPFTAQFGDPVARPREYAYRLPFATGTHYAVLQGFHGPFSHTGGNEYAVDFDCPVATRVLAARPGIVVASNASAQSSGTTPEFRNYDHVNWVLVLHDDGTLGQYMHLAPAGVEVQPGTMVQRGDELALSGHTGFSSTPHLHFMVMTAAEDGVSTQTFSFKLAVGPNRAEEPRQGTPYRSWE
jgi:murein DD-endopeptidase MepM/ murein hydrolase activator NlpD